MMYFISFSSMSGETKGIRLLRTLLSCKPEQLGHTIQKKILSAGKNGLNKNLTFQLNDTLGRGSFATVFSASLLGSKSLVAIKMAIRTKTTQGRIHSSRLSHMIHECDILRILQSSPMTPSSSSSSSSKSVHNNRIHFPSLYDNEWKCTEAQPFLPMIPIGIPLVVFASQHDKATRMQLAETLENHLTKSLTFAHSKGYCHRDLRPDNVIYDDEKKVFVIIDWGLGAEVNSKMHEYKGGIVFFHDKIVRYLSNKKTGSLSYIPKYDIASASYVVYAFKRGSSNLSVPWKRDCVGGETLIAERKKHMTNA